MPKSYFDLLNKFIRKRHRWIIIAWVVAVLLSLVLIPSFFSSVSYDITGSFGGPPNTEADKAASIVKTQFPSTSSSSESNIIIVVIQGTPVYSDLLRQKVLALNETLYNDKDVGNYTGESSLYSLEASLLNSSVPTILSQAAGLQSNISSINSGLYMLQSNLSELSLNLFQLQDGINQTAQLIYGIPAAFVGAWQGIVAQGVTDPEMANLEANATVYSLTSNFGGDAQSIGYYQAFFGAWSSSFQTLSNDTAVSNREAFAVNQAVTSMLISGQLDSQTSIMVSSVASNLTVLNWNRPQAISNLTISTMTSSIPADLSSALGASPSSIVNQLYSFGYSPSNSTLGNYAITLLQQSYSSLTSADAGFSVSDLMQSTYQLGASPNSTQTWNLACDFISNATENTFKDSPLFTINSASLSSLLSDLSPNATITDIDNVINNLISTQSYTNYPYLASRALTGNFVNSQNNTMLVIFGFSSSTDQNTIDKVESNVQNSGLHNLGTVYVTGGSVLSKDVEKAFLPALELTIGPGIGISLLIVGLLFLAPVAALIPVLLGGISVSVALAAIYEAVVGIGKGNLTFLTPTLTILLMLGLAVDYSVLQLRRTREERQKGKSIEESVSTSIKWAGQAVLTAGMTVIVAYIVMAVANVPIFSDVGTSIALGVSILLAASLTLLPSLEIALGDRMFWPGLNKLKRAKSDPNKNVLKRLAHSTLKRKVPIVIIISIVALSAFAVMYNTPTGEDFLKLIPNFQSNQGLTAIANSFGSGTLEPTSIVITTPTQITYGNNQFNQTLLNQIEQITVAAANSKGVVSVSGPTRPFENSFNYSSLENMSETLSTQYKSQIFTTIGKDNKTAVITVNFSDGAFTPTAMNSLHGLEKNISQLSLLNGITVHYGGATQSTIDSQAFMANLIPEVVAILAAAVYVILFIQLRSAFTPIRLIITILCSVVFALAIISLIFFDALNLPILDFAPLFVVVTMLGVGIDYDIFFLTRIREEVLGGKTDNEAIVTAIDKVWVTILGLGLVLATVFASLLITNIAILQEIALAVAAAIVIDVTVVILFFVPSLMGLAQKFNWWPYKLSRNGTEDKNQIKAKNQTDESKQKVKK
ncbi:MAG: MMPL family transporter [Candidatus Bathyarchaeia archaeon]